MSDSDTTDSDHGIRYKTESTRHKGQSSEKYSFPEKDTVRRKEKYSSHKHSRKKFKRNETESSSDEEYYKRNRDRRKQRNYDESKPDILVNKSNNKNNSSNPSFSTVVSFGPVLPPHLQQKLNNSDPKPNYDINVPIGPVLPPHLQQVSTTETHLKKDDEIVGPIPLSEVNHKASNVDLNNTSIIGKPENEITVDPIKTNSTENETAMDSGDITTPTVGPALPPHMLNKNLETELPESNKTGCTSQTTIIGPALPPQLRQQLLNDFSHDSKEDEVYGPMPEGTNLTKAHLELEERALQMRIDQLDTSHDKPTREEWMVELPAAKRAAFGLGPRSFKKKAGPDLSDRSSWTDTPQDKVKKKTEAKVNLQEEARLKELNKRDQEQEEIIKKHKKKKESLLDMHTKKMKTNKKDTDGSSERRPFSREVDLQVNRFDEAQKKAILKKAQLLDDRFSSGEAKFL